MSTRKPPLTDESLAARLAVQVMGWRLAPGRFLTGNRSWTPRWRFQPERNLNDAFRLLQMVQPEYYMVRAEGSQFIVRVQISGHVGDAEDACKPLAITRAVARALRIEPEPEI